MKKSDITDLLNKILDKKTSSGIDKISPKTIKRCGLSLNYVNEVYESLCGKKEYKFCKYKQLLKIKNFNENPRLISIPTIKDKLMLSSLHDFYLAPLVKRRKTNDIVHDIKTDLLSRKYTNFLKTDISHFYDSISIPLLISKLECKKLDSTIIQLINQALHICTVDLNKNKKSINRLTKKDFGVPQGIVISNTLAEIYMEEFDEVMHKIDGISYYRFVDDILILYNNRIITKNNLFKTIDRELTSLHLKQNYKKNDSNFICKKDINFIGFLFKNGVVSLRDEIIQKKERQLERLIFDFARLKDGGPLYKNDYYLCWKLNNSIAGFVSNGKIYSWVQTYKNVDDEKIFHHLDALTRKLLKRAKLKRPIELKSFGVAYNYLIHNNKKYLENFDINYKNTDDKRAFLEKLINIDKKCSDSTVVDIFNDLVKKTIYESERDLDFKYHSNY